MGVTFDLTDKKFGKLTVLERDETKKNGPVYWICKCECGNKISVRGQTLRDGKKTNCGCIKKIKPIDKTSLVNKKFGRLTVLERDLSKPIGKGKEAYWICKCECGRKISVSTGQLNAGRTKSCGCLRSELLTKRNTLNLAGKRFGKLVAIENTKELSNHGSYIWKCQCDCGNIHYVSAENLQSGKIHSCGCMSSSFGEEKIESILIDNNIFYQKEYSFPDLKNLETNRYYRYDFAIFDKNNKIIRLIEFDGEQHYKEEYQFHTFFDYNKIKKSDNIKNMYALKRQIPLVRIPYSELNNLSLEILFSDKYLIREVSI